MSRRGGAPSLAAALAGLAIWGCGGARPWTVDESDRIDEVMAPAASAGVPAPADAGLAEDPVEDGLEELLDVLEKPLAMGPAPPLAPPTSRVEQLQPTTSWNDRPWRHGKRFYLGYRRVSGRYRVARARDETR